MARDQIEEQDQLTAGTLRENLEGFIGEAEFVGAEKALEIDSVFLRVLREVETYMEPDRTVQDTAAAFAQFHQMVKGKKGREYHPLLKELTKGWTRADLHAVSLEVFGYYGINQE